MLASGAAAGTGLCLEREHVERKVTREWGAEREIHSPSHPGLTLYNSMGDREIET